MLELRNVTRVYTSRSGPAVRALDNISLTFPEKGMVFIVGKSGCGKTTLINILSGIDFPTGGELLIDGVSTKKYTSRHYDRYRSQYAALIFQQYNLLYDFTVRENIRLATEFQGAPADDDRIDKLLEAVDMAGMADRKPSELSGGQQQRVAIARTLAKNPSLILADEPTGALDSNTGRQIMDVLKQISKEKLVVIVSHDRELAEIYADRCITMADGRIADDTAPCVAPAEVASAKPVKKLPRHNISFRTALQIGRACIRGKTVRFVAVILLSVLAFSFLGIADILADYQKETSFADSLYHSDASYLAVKKSAYLSYPKAKGWYSDGFSLRQEDMDALQEQTGRTFLGVYRPALTELNIENNYAMASRGKGNKENYCKYVEKLSGFVDFTEQDMNAYGYDLIAGRLPDGDANEIALSKYVFDSFAICGYSDYFTANVIDHDTGERVCQTNYFERLMEELGYIPDDALEDVDQKPRTYSASVTQYEDLIGKAIMLGDRAYTITGIIDTHFDLSPYTQLTGEENEIGEMGLDWYSLMNAGKFEMERNYGLHCVAFVGSGRVDKIRARYSQAVTVEGLELTFSNEYMILTVDNIVKASDLAENAPPVCLQNIGMGSCQNMGYTQFLYDDIFNPDTTLLVDKEELKGVDWCDLKYTMRLSYTDSRETDVSQNWRFDHYGEAGNGPSIRSEVEGGPLILQDYNFPDAVVLSDDFFDRISKGRDGIYAYAVTPIPEDITELQQMRDYCETGDTVRYPICTAVSYELNTMDSTFTNLASVCQSIGLVFALFAVFMFANFILSSISAKQRDIGIMRSLGATGGDVFEIFLTESLVTAMWNFFLSCALTFGATLIANGIMKQQFHLLLEIAHFSVRQVVILFALSFGAALLSSYFPIRKISRKKPVDIIRNA